MVCFLPQIFQAQEVYDNSLSLVKGTFSAAVLESNRLLLGTEEGIYIAELAKDGTLPNNNIAIYIW